MAINYPYKTDIPLATNKPSVDQPNMKINTNSINSIIATDHLTFGTATGLLTDGYHTTIHQPNQIIGGQLNWNPVVGSGVPAAVTATKIAGVQQLFPILYTPDTAGATADTQLFSLTGGGGISQLTGNLVGNDGWAWLGGILIQWGVISMSFSSGSTTGTVTFKNRVAGAIPFPNNCFVVTANPLVSFMHKPASQASVNIQQSTLSNTSFTYQFYTNSGDYIGFIWMAIGN